MDLVGEQVAEAEPELDAAPRQGRKLNTFQQFKSYRKHSRDIWESYALINFYMNHLHDQMKSENLPTFELPNLIIKNTYRQLGTRNTLGATHHLTLKSNPRRTLVNAVSLFEDYKGSMTYDVYLRYPSKLVDRQQEKPQWAAELKLMDIITGSADKDEMISKIAEEKVRSIFYGNPLDFFERDKGKLEFGDYFKTECRNALLQYKEINARRNIFVHNEGKVDRKYLREVTNSTFLTGHAAPLTQDYLRESMLPLEGMAAAATGLVLKNIYNIVPTKRGSSVGESWAIFERMK